VNNETEGWNIMPELNPDQLTVACKQNTTQVAFITDIDSIKFTITPRQHYYFNILLNNKDTALTEVIGVKYVKPATFDEEYIKQHRGKVVVEIPEVQELVHIIFAITDTGRQDPNMVDMTTDYYKQVIEHFDAYRQHPVVIKFDSLLKIGYYIHLKMNSCAYIFKGNAITKGKVYDRLSWTDNNTLDPYISNIQDFSNKSGFREFYQNHLDYYNSLIKEQERLVSVKTMWEWLEKQFPSKYDSYKITFSPLVYGNHSTNRFEDNDFSEIVMFISGPKRRKNSKNYSKIWEGLLLSRIVFTEIDHNYVNPQTDKYKNDVDSVFSDIDNWATQRAIKYYSSPYNVFNEYMTWAVFTLYLYDNNFSQDDFKTVNKKTEDLMADQRGFYRYREFNDKLLDLYKNREENQTVVDLYPDILDWCSTMRE